MGARLLRSAGSSQARGDTWGAPRAGEGAARTPGPSAGPRAPPTFRRTTRRPPAARTAPAPPRPGRSPPLRLPAPAPAPGPSTHSPPRPASSRARAASAPSCPRSSSPRRRRLRRSAAAAEAPIAAAPLLSAAPSRAPQRRPRPPLRGSWAAGAASGMGRGRRWGRRSPNFTAGPDPPPRRRRHAGRAAGRERGGEPRRRARGCPGSPGGVPAGGRARGRRGVALLRRVPPAEPRHGCRRFPRSRPRSFSRLALPGGFRHRVRRAPLPAVKVFRLDRQKKKTHRAGSPAGLSPATGGQPSPRCLCTARTVRDSHRGVRVPLRHGAPNDVLGERCPAPPARP